jgi:hypothetical protein
VPDFVLPKPKAIHVLEKELDEWFVEKKRGRGARVFVYAKDDGCWFLVRHGDPFRREGSLDEGKSGGVYYRPEKFDVLVYNPRLGEICMNARSKGEKAKEEAAKAAEVLQSIFGEDLKRVGASNVVEIEIRPDTVAMEPLDAAE